MPAGPRWMCVVRGFEVAEVRDSGCAVDDVGGCEASFDVVICGLAGCVG